MTRKWIDQDGVVRVTTEINLGRYHGALTLLEPDEEDRLVAMGAMRGVNRKEAEKLS